MIEILLGCSLLFTTEPTPDMINTYRLCNHIEDTEQWQYKVYQYFQEDTMQALSVMSCESDGIVNATNTNKDGSKDIGLFQFNERTTRWIEKDIYKRSLDMFDPITNIRVARWLQSNSGWHHWNASKHCWGKYEY